MLPFSSYLWAISGHMTFSLAIITLETLTTSLSAIPIPFLSFVWAVVCYMTSLLTVIAKWTVFALT
jgi:hypothetical protein